MELTTKQQAATMAEGMALDTQIALLLGYKPHKGYPNRWLTPNGKCSLYEHSLPAFSIDIAAAWQLLEGRGWVIQEETQAPLDKWEVYKDGRALEDGRWLALGPTAPLAICRAALVASISSAPAVPVGV